MKLARAAMVQVVGEDETRLDATTLRALDILQSHRERVLSGERLRTIAVIAVYDPSDTDPPDTASVTAADWHCAKGVVPAEVVGVLFGLATGISRGG